MSDSDLEPEPSIVLGIPGKWKDHSEIVTSIARNSGGYLFAGGILMHIDSKTSFELDIYDHDPELAEKVRWGGLGQIPEEDLAALEDHTFTLYLVSFETGREVVERMMDAAVALLDAGGLVVKIESAGFSVGATKWREHASVKAPYSLQRAMVTLVGEEREYFTCGMRAFGLPDCMILDSDLDTAFEASIEFCCYMIDEAPKLAEGHLVKLTESPTKYRLAFEDYTHYPPDDHFHNPHGQWVLEPLKED
ncbi:MAG TPA: hypothetical protein VGE67_07905 [Haloferula sp.]